MVLVSFKAPEKSFLLSSVGLLPEDHSLRNASLSPSMTTACTQWLPFKASEKRPGINKHGAMTKLTEEAFPYVSFDRRGAQQYGCVWCTMMN
ncbi:hypothetical protein CEXT_10441 [Caerostris extrusa]|uniref:Uncharacterized protein n=1 Tax=Caerostris extrusa TaxID=172846 RepID=A0AAV4XY19_CAEEX|nr:hypothetical protein CEXT_10441 [Caerostris extrusa]